mgnify:CR=1
MTVLLDTQVFIWMFSEPSRIAPSVLAEMRRASLLLSIVSPWEMMIKYSRGKLHIDHTPDRIVEEHCQRGIITLLPLELAHISHLLTLPHHHKDPFDRIIIAQALTERIPIISSDAAFDGYGVQRMWE